MLSHSRYKWGWWYTVPLTSAQLVAALEECFEYMGGMPAELVFDQDRLVAVDENYGDIVYTKEFEQFRRRMGFSVYLCRAADPPSKGRVEAVVKYLHIPAHPDGESGGIRTGVPELSGQHFR